MPSDKNLYGETRPVPLDDERGWGNTVTGILSDSIDGLDGISFLLESGVVLFYLEPTQTTLASSATLTVTHPIHLVQSNSGFSVTLDGATAIADGTKNGQILILVGVGTGPNQVIVPDSANTLLNGEAILSNSVALVLVWDGLRSAWQELTRSN